jgi:excisionase family DNA binding protein
MTRGPSEEKRRRQAAEPLTVRVATAVRLTGIGRSTLYDLINAGEIETVKIGRSTFIPCRCLKRLLNR